MTYHRSNFKSIANLIAPLVKRHGHVNIMSYSKLLNIWETVVGEEMSKKAHPIGMKTIKGGRKSILFLGMTGPYMAELSLQKRDIIEKINSYYSKDIIDQIKLQRTLQINDKNVVELDNLNDFGAMKSEDSTGSKLAIVHLEQALTKMKNNLNNSRKKNEIMED